MKVNVFVLRAFTRNKKGGNAAGVVLEGDLLTAQQMQKIASKVGLSETAFIGKSKKADFKLRFFTPQKEVDFCGHATLAAFFHLYQSKPLNPGQYVQETKSGILKVTILQNGKILIDQSLPKFLTRVPLKEVREALEFSENDINWKNLIPQVVSTGLKDLLISVNSNRELLNFKPNFKKIIKLQKKYNLDSLHLFSLLTRDKITANCRNFSPLLGINEESATGSANGALGCYLFKKNIISKDLIGKGIVVQQGQTMNQDSELVIKLKIAEDRKILRVQAGGKAIFIKTITSNLVH